jgi:hypothetical protein
LQGWQKLTSDGVIAMAPGKVPTRDVRSTRSAGILIAVAVPEV